ncbi:MAG: hypothetical protein USCAAHI_00877 [Beijerinckiaceae bacterium]|jgi:hypothetical protein|nr:MAG: hypothetical protein USCAAHI_00877 [Beijerinckiaceae bacterium]
METQIAAAMLIVLLMLFVDWINILSNRMDAAMTLDGRKKDKDQDEYDMQAWRSLITGNHNVLPCEAKISASVFTK